MRPQRAHSLLTSHGIRAEIIQHGESPVVWIPSQEYVRAIDLMTRTAEAASSPCEACVNETEARFDVCWSCQDR